jgi:hypothetical protein
VESFDVSAGPQAAASVLRARSLLGRSAVEAVCVERSASGEGCIEARSLFAAGQIEKISCRRSAMAGDLRVRPHPALSLTVSISKSVRPTPLRHTAHT